HGPRARRPPVRASDEEGENEQAAGACGAGHAGAAAWPNESRRALNRRGEEYRRLRQDDDFHAKRHALVFCSCGHPDDRLQAARPYPAVVPRRSCPSSKVAFLAGLSPAGVNTGVLCVVIHCLRVRFYFRSV
ncbi:unnamed protein product, partial [Prorocentrum cordatum]